MCALDYAGVSALADAVDDIVVDEIENWQAVFAASIFRCRSSRAKMAVEARVTKSERAPTGWRRLPFFISRSKSGCSAFGQSQLTDK
jgi:hypothetical protein